ncbi:TetR/AcrR family transcriptional regulator [uncultured Methylobacterium sp.]|uniref:TetR/AcrR family transcriptional regulator n=1 Tax=uncultured Methylobacterium sp. TaxID=157278 RepID=UPI00262A53AB|nr:TetR/AcrR family transcriptional regulator [uncultured Methylobacterium sp.]
MTAPSGRAATVAVLAEVFRERGYEGASLALIGARTGLGKGSLYHLFPGGKAEMAAAVLTEIGDWFEAAVFAPLRDGDPADGIRTMLAQVRIYFRSGRRMCLVGILALTGERDLFAGEIAGYFYAWRTALADALRRAGHGREADDLSEQCVAAIQGALVLARALDDPEVFERALAAWEQRLLPPV